MRIPRPDPDGPSMTLVCESCECQRKDGAMPAGSALRSPKLSATSAFQDRGGSDPGILGTPMARSLSTSGQHGNQHDFCCCQCCCVLGGGDAHAVGFLSHGPPPDMGRRESSKVGAFGACGYVGRVEGRNSSYTPPPPPLSRRSSASINLNHDSPSKRGADAADGQVDLQDSQGPNLCLDVPCGRWLRWPDQLHCRKANFKSG